MQLIGRIQIGNKTPIPIVEVTTLMETMVMVEVEEDPQEEEEATPRYVPFVEGKVHS